MFRCVVITMALLVCLDSVMALNECYSCEHNAVENTGDINCYDNYLSSAYEVTCEMDDICQVTTVKISDIRIFVTRGCISKYLCYHGCQKGGNPAIAGNELCVTCCDGDLCNIGNGSTGLISSMLTLFLIAGSAIFTLV
ncbi:uncharacterized protein [Ptychodera flava]|uniref:uncharacterized protein n=1 Tax=Ptychodera flava TaxID=63121 RepID=UPI003969FE5F